ncbi:MAG: 6,7-dimethyl-8-ribityllumazine synthase [Nitrospinota bacterium]
MKEIYEGDLNGSSLKVAIVVSRFNSFLTEKLLEGALDCLLRHTVNEKNIMIVKSPGAFELPLIADKIAKQKKVDAIIALGVIIRGATPHFDYVAAECSKGLANVMMDNGIALTFGVVTADNLEQAIERSGSKMGNKGFDAALAAIEMSNLLKKLV